MSAITVQQLLMLADAFGAHRCLSHWRVSFLLRGDGQFIDRLRRGGGCTVRTAERALAWFSDNWPADLAWPPSVPRPPGSKEAA